MNKSDDSSVVPIVIDMKKWLILLKRIFFTHFSSKDDEENGSFDTLIFYLRRNSSLKAQLNLYLLNRTGYQQ